jgi:hypothetical protein
MKVDKYSHNHEFNVIYFISILCNDAVTSSGYTASKLLLSIRLCYKPNNDSMSYYEDTLILFLIPRCQETKILAT